MIKAILFDFDGVLTIDKTGSETITRYLAQRTNIPLDVVESNYYKYNDRLLAGEITHADMWSDFCQQVGEEIDYQILIDSFINTDWDTGMFTYIQELKKTYKIGMITDNKADRIETILNYHHYKEYFDIVAVSAIQHTCKKDVEIFQYVINGLGIKAEECVFIDNSPQNLIMPDRMGMATILFDDENRDLEQFKQDLNVYITKVG